MTTHDKAGRPYAKLSELKAGDVVELDGDFTCRAAGKARLFERDGNLYFDCSEGGHNIRGQADDGEHCMGIYLAKVSG
jgi:hypothetical protein